MEIAATPETRRRGLMHRDALPEDHGMLFVFPEDAPREFWMKNTRIPLSIAFLDVRGRVMRIADLEPHSLEPVPSLAPARYALEVNRGWFARHGVRAGDRLALPALPEPE